GEREMLVNLKTYVIFAVLSLTLAMGAASAIDSRGLADRLAIVGVVGKSEAKDSGVVVLYDRSTRKHVFKKIGDKILDRYTIVAAEQKAVSLQGPQGLVVLHKDKFDDAVVASA